MNLWPDCIQKDSCYWPWADPDPTCSL